MSELVIVQNNYIERMNNLNAVQSGYFGKWYGYSATFCLDKSTTTTKPFPLNLAPRYSGVLNYNTQ